MLIRAIFKAFPWSLLVLISPISCSRQACCLRNGVSEECAQNLCDPHRPPGDVARYSLFDGRHNCSSYLTEISQCLTDGRDNLQCCEQNAKDPEERSCFGLCSGEISLFEPFRDLMSCLALNLPPIYDCILKGYKTIPSPPIKLKIESGILRWDRPKNNSHLVTRYKIYISDNSRSRSIELIRETTSANTRFNLTNLRLGSHYSVYVIAESLSGRSQASEQLNMGVSSESEWPKVVTSSNSSNVFLSCALRTRHERAHIDWEKQSASKSWTRLEGVRFQKHSTRSLDEPVIFAALRISRPKASDNGTYRCVVRGHASVMGEVNLVVMSSTKGTRSPLPASPPETPFECCSRQITSPNCTSYCTIGTSPRHQIRPGAYLPYHNCSDEMHHLLQCTLTDAKSASCCIFKKVYHKSLACLTREKHELKVPHQCLGLCDRSFTLKNSFDAVICMSYFTDILQCHEDSMKNLPAAVPGLRLSTTDDVTIAEWKPVSGVSGYSVYYKRKLATQWKSLQISTTTAKLHGAEMIALQSSLLQIILHKFVLIKC